jgi:hypothetical protein
MPSGSWIHISIKPHGSVTGPRMMGTPAAASRACSAWTSRTCIQIVTDCPAGPGLCPETSSKPGPRKNTTPGSSGGPNSRWMARPSTSRQKRRLRSRSLGRTKIRLLRTSMLLFQQHVE